jgi:hypothetical protein
VENVTEIAGMDEHPLASKYPCRTPVWWARYGEVGKHPNLPGASGRKIALRIEKSFGRIEGMFARLLRAPKEVRRPLDTMNSMLWELADGSRRFSEVCTILDDLYSEDIAPVLHRTAAAVAVFQQQNLMLMLDEPLEQRWLVGPGCTPEHQVLGEPDPVLMLDSKPIEGDAP